jgi:hypothetical protein
MNLEKLLFEVQKEISFSEKGTQQLNEGLIFFKNSKRLKKVADKLAKKAFTQGGKEGYEEIEDIIDRLNEIANEFDKVERKYLNNISFKSSDFMSAKSDYQELVIKYKAFMKIVTRQSYINLLSSGFRLAFIAAPLVIAFNEINVFKEFVDNTFTNVGQESLEKGMEAATKARERIESEPGYWDPKTRLWVPGGYTRLGLDIANREMTGEITKDGPLQQIETEMIDSARRAGKAFQDPFIEKLTELKFRIFSFLGVSALLNVIRRKVTDNSLLALTERAVRQLQRMEANAQRVRKSTAETDDESRIEAEMDF